MGKIFPYSVKKPPALDTPFMKYLPIVSISCYIYCIINILDLNLFIYMYWRNTCIELMGTWSASCIKLKKHKRRTEGQKKRFKESAASYLAFSPYL